MSSWLERVKLEEKELSEKIEKLESFLNLKDSKEDIDLNAICLLKAQIVWMKNYQEVLQVRIALAD